MDTKTKTVSSQKAKLAVTDLTDVTFAAFGPEITDVIIRITGGGCLYAWARLWFQKNYVFLLLPRHRPGC